MLFVKLDKEKLMPAIIVAVVAALLDTFLNSNYLHFHTSTHIIYRYTLTLAPYMIVDILTLQINKDFPSSPSCKQECHPISSVPMCAATHDRCS